MEYQTEDWKGKEERDRPQILSNFEQSLMICLLTTLLKKKQTQR